MAVHAATTPASISVIGSSAQAPITGYAGVLSWCDECSYHHYIPGPCRVKFCKNYGQEGHLAGSCRTPTNQASGAGISQAYYGCGKVGHYKRICANAATTGNTGRVLAIGQGEAATDPIVATGIFLFDNPYACNPFQFYY